MTSVIRIASAAAVAIAVLMAAPESATAADETFLARKLAFGLDLCRGFLAGRTPSQLVAQAQARGWMQMEEHDDVGRYDIDEVAIFGDDVSVIVDLRDGCDIRVKGEKTSQAVALAVIDRKLRTWRPRAVEAPPADDQHRVWRAPGVWKMAVGRTAGPSPWRVSLFLTVERGA